MRGLHSRKDLRSEADEALNDAEPFTSVEETAGYEAECNAPVPGLAVKNASRGKKVRGPKRLRFAGDKVYAGVRVKMPVRDMLKKIRLAQGCQPQEAQDTYRKKGERVKTYRGRKPYKRRCPSKSLEELAIIVEVLEEDLKTDNKYHQTFPCSNPPASPEWSSGPTGYNSDSSEEMIPSPQSYMSYSPGTADNQRAMSPEYRPCSSPRISRLDELQGPQSWCTDSSAFFWTQLQKEEMILNNMSDAELLATDEYGRNSLHNVVCVGKRALAYAIAKRMAAINSLDMKDCDGMTALLYAAKNNHHLMVVDLIRLGASINERNYAGKSCLHLSAERGYCHVLEVLKRMMMEGMFVDVEATDNSGMSVLQCASVALKTTVCDVEISRSPLCSRLHRLRKEQMLETLECLLQMGSYPHTMGCWGMLPHCT